MRKGHTTIQRYTIVAQKFDKKQTTFCLKKANSKEIVERTAYAISLDTNILKLLNSEDAYLIGYVNATEKIFSEKYFSFIPQI